MVSAYITEFDLHDLGEEFFNEILPRMKAAMVSAAGVWLQGVRAELSRRGPPQPGAAPAYRTGELYRSYKVTPVTVNKTGKSLRCGVKSDHAAAGLLEFGGIVVRDGSLAGLTVRKRRERKRELGKTGGRGVVRYSPHPHLRPAAEKNRERIIAAMEDF